MPAPLYYCDPSYVDDSYVEVEVVPFIPSAELAAFILFIRNVMGITQAQLPDDSLTIQWSLDFANDTVSPFLRNAGCNIYNMAVYNLAGDTLLGWSQDQPGQTFFADARKAYGINNFTAGVVSSSSDESTSSALTTPEYFKHFTLSNLRNLKTPYGLQYLSIAQDIGPLWGLT